jgi:hypothetical protein
MADTRQAGGCGAALLGGRYAAGRELRCALSEWPIPARPGSCVRGGCPSADCQGEDIQTRGLAWAQCHLKGAISGTVSGVVAPIYLPPDASLGCRTEVRLRNVLPLTICGGTPPSHTTPRLSTQCHRLVARRGSAFDECHRSVARRGTAFRRSVIGSWRGEARLSTKCHRPRGEGRHGFSTRCHTYRGRCGLRSRDTGV